MESTETIQYRSHPGALFPKLPRDAAEAEAGWESVQDEDKTTFKPLGTAAGFVFEGIQYSPMNKVYLSSSKSKYTFDAAKGFVTRADGIGVRLRVPDAEEGFPLAWISSHLPSSPSASSRPTSRR
jgi:hypothetical protein